MKQNFVKFFMPLSKTLTDLLRANTEVKASLFELYLLTIDGTGIPIDEYSCLEKHIDKFSEWFILSEGIVYNKGYILAKQEYDAKCERNRNNINKRWNNDNENIPVVYDSYTSRTENDTSRIPVVSKNIPVVQKMIRVVYKGILNQNRTQNNPSEPKTTLWKYARIPYPTKTGYPF